MKRLIRGYKHSEVARDVYREVCDIRPRAIYCGDRDKWLEVWKATRKGIKAIEAEKYYPGKNGDLKELEKWKAEAFNYVTKDVAEYLERSRTGAAC